MVTKKDYDAVQVEGARSVMLELVRLLAEYRADIVVVGGWVPALLIPQDRKPHIGSTDVDLALNHRTLTGPGYKTICRLHLLALARAALIYLAIGIGFEERRRAPGRVEEQLQELSLPPFLADAEKV